MAIHTRKSVKKPSYMCGGQSAHPDPHERLGQCNAANLLDGGAHDLVYVKLVVFAAGSSGSGLSNSTPKYDVGNFDRRPARVFSGRRWRHQITRIRSGRPDGGFTTRQVLPSAFSFPMFLHRRRIIMFGRSICIVSIALMLLTAGNAGAELVGWWRLDGDASDSSGNGNDGVLFGDPQWVDGKIGGALEFDGVDDRVEMPGTSPAEGFPSFEGEVTWAVWFKTPGGGRGTVIAQDPPGGAHVSGNRQLNVETTGHLRIRANSVGALNSYNSNITVNDDEWHHAAITIAFEPIGTNDAMKVYIDGDLGSGYELDSVDINSRMAASTDFIFMLGYNAGAPFLGLIDDVRVYDHVLSQEEILVAMAGGGGGNPLAGAPNPADGALYENTWANLGWRAGYYAVSHDVYFGTSFDDVNNGVEGTFAGNLATTFQVVGFPGFPEPGGLVPGTTYYWRVDEVNDANASSPWKGDVWSFMVPPKIAYQPDPADGARFTPTDVTLSWTPGLNAKLHSVYFGDNLDDVGNAVGAVPDTETT
ncbi:MAG TPA: LamG domain-containing protein, partial [Phycisphaerales bacterium]|nr:LamG domain-containing protein [Phycisphaerales bacterium]